MSRLAGRNDASTPKHLTLDSLFFSMFTKEDIQKLCVTKIHTPLTLDALGHPLPGGLYDKSLGPLTEKSEPCGTCRKNIHQCPGHFGYIDLPLPVVNPIFHKIIGGILRISCLNCFCIQIQEHIKYTISLQIKLLNCGLVTDAVEISNRIAELISTHGALGDIPEEALEGVKQFERHAEEALVNSSGKYALNKNTESLRNQFISEMLKEVKIRRVCMFCKNSMDRIQLLRNKIILSSRKDSENLSSSRVRTVESKYVTPEESRKYMRNLYNNEKELMLEIVAVLTNVNAEHPTDVFYCDLIPVVPPNVRPVNIVNGRISEHPMSHMYKSILQNTLLLKLIIQVMKNGGDSSDLSAEAKGVYNFTQGGTPVEKLNHAWEALQFDVDCLMDSSNVRNPGGGEGLKQVLEKKAGIIRMHMMGKRVNFSARSVITPDPNLDIDEIGIPEYFAKNLTYPVPVTSWNVKELRKMIMNGPDVHPGAVMVEYEDGSIKRINTKNTTQQESILKRLLTPDDKEKGFRGVKRVHRHLVNGDILLLNRQPTLHKPSIMAHTARILKGEKTLRLHYANCKAYNADFDGDEMNAHFPQNELARSEAYNIANVSNQYLVPKDGTPLSGLIQDHMIAGVKLSLRGRFFNKTDYQQLVFQALAHKMGKIILQPPAILKPRRLWSGKQILSTVIVNVIPEGRELINLTASAKIGAKAWQTHPARQWKAGGSPFTNPNAMSEAEVVIREGELLVGVLDKTHYGATPYGLVHCVYEVGTVATRLLSALAKLFTRFLQEEGFTLGVRDILTIPKADKKRRDIIKKSRRIGLGVMTEALGLSGEVTVEDIVQKIEEGNVNNPKLRGTIDRQYKASLDSYTNDINKTCLPAGLVCKFPENNLQLMVQSGAKGTTVNTMQISCLLGQIELEGKRPPVMICGKSLPSFPIFEFTPRAGGFIDGRFMTGIQPQEFFFHCMAGREGLIDTAVKTSRSGYLQRCLIKHLEGLTVGYDMTVRDTDKSVIQFLYGEDGMDISKVQFLNEKQLNFLFENCKAILDKSTIKSLKSEDEEMIKQHRAKLLDWRQKYGNPLRKERKSPFSLFSAVVRQKVEDPTFGPDQILKVWRRADDEIKASFQGQCVPCPAPLNSLHQSDHHFGVLNERLDSLMSGFYTNDRKKERQFQNMFKLKGMTSLCAPGEPIGLLAAQSIGEPSTQMTLNTFHFAGRGEMNVTLGIPRLREILMMASKSIKTPSMEIPFLPVEGLEEEAERLRKVLTRVVVADVLEKIDVTAELAVKPTREHRYVLKFHFLPRKLYKNDYHVTSKYVLKHMAKRFFGEMFTAIRKYSKINSNLVMMEEERRQRTANEDDDGEDNRNEDTSDEEPEDTEDAKTTNKFQQVHDDQEPEVEEQEASDEEPEEEIEENPDRTEENAVVDSYNFAQNYFYDKKKYLWCEITFALPLNFKKLDLTAILKDVAAKSVVWETPSIKRAITYVKDDQLMLRTDGINILEMFKYHKLLDLNKLSCNDIHKMAETYGIEAAMKVIVKEVRDVFNVYGITVNPRHLSLVADYMTYNGTFEPLSRKGMESSASPLQQMSFESSLTVLRNAAVGGKRDQLENPSSCLIAGTPCKTGTGCFTLLQKNLLSSP